MLPPSSITSNQQNLRNRVAATFYKAIQYANEQATATYYNYDISGNVKTLWQQIVSMRSYDGTGIKQIDYNYDLVSGKVNHVWYQKGKKDQYYYQYNYDAENRVVEALSGISNSNNSTEQLKQDAAYKYYLHGPLARTQLGTNVQGIDYAYTLQGWLKGVNGTYLNPSADMGKDASTAIPGRSIFCPDVFSYVLNYYGSNTVKDYTDIGGNALTSSTFLPYTFQTNKANLVGRPLYNGNIAAISLALSKLDNGQTTGYSYGYDQLNRLLNMRKHNADISAGNTATSWGYNSAMVLASNAYGEQYTYDANGNIQTLIRNGANTATNHLKMDSLQYSYYYKNTSGNWGEYGPGLPAPNDVAEYTNKLYRVRDDINNTDKYTIDIDNQATQNYTYDKIGNLIGDVAEGITNIYWTVYGKISSIAKYKAETSTLIRYEYDVSGNRISKQVGNKITFYIRDAQGNVMGVYDATLPRGRGIPPTGYTWQEQHLYGSSRLGMFTPRQVIALGTIAGGPEANATEELGQRTYELSNHLGNVHVTISNKRIPQAAGFVAEVLSTTDYYPFGMAMPGRNGYKLGTGGWATGTDAVSGTNMPQSLAVDSRTANAIAEYKATQFIEFLTGFSSGNSDNFTAEIATSSNTNATSSLTANGGSENIYRYGFNGKELDNSTGEGNLDFGARIMDVRLGRWLSVDPLGKSFPNISPYNYANNNPIFFIDEEGKFSINNHAKFTKDVLKKLNYSEVARRYVSHYASVYADHPPQWVQAAQQNFKTELIDYSRTAKSQDPDVEHNTWHSMKAPTEKVSDEFAMARGQEFGWGKIIEASSEIAAVGGLENYFYTKKAGTNQTVSGIKDGIDRKGLEDLGQGIHALQDAIAHRGASMSGKNAKKHSVWNDMYPSKADINKANSVTNSALISMEVLSGNYSNLKSGMTIDLTGTNADQFEKIKGAFQIAVNASTEKNFTITLTGKPAEKKKG